MVLIWRFGDWRVNRQIKNRQILVQCTCAIRYAYKSPNIKFANGMFWLFRLNLTTPKIPVIWYIYIYNYIYIPAQATNGPTARDKAPIDRKMPITFPFSSPSPASKRDSIRIPVSADEAFLEISSLHPYMCMHV